MTSDNEPRTRNQELSVCPRCGKEFHCSKSGKCWCYSVFLTLDKLEEIESRYDSCLCPSCLNEYAGPAKPLDGKFTRDQFVITRKKKTL
jgi:hypothetical protein